MFFFSMIEDGPRGLSGPSSQHEEADPEDGEDISTFGIDWDDIDNEALMEHHQDHNPLETNNPFSTSPATLSEVVCTPPDCPLSEEGTRQLNYHLSHIVNGDSRSMLVRRNIWVEALRLCSQLS
jgi:hypothetical protein